MNYDMSTWDKVPATRKQAQAVISMTIHRLGWHSTHLSYTALCDRLNVKALMHDEDTELIVMAELNKKEASDIINALKKGLDKRAAKIIKGETDDNSSSLSSR